MLDRSNTLGCETELFTMELGTSTVHVRGSKLT